MKLHVNKDGSFDLDITENDDLAKAAKFIREIQEQPEEFTPEENLGGSDLNKLQYETWTWLIENDRNNGVHHSAMARFMGITEKAASQRLMTLRRLGYAKRVGAGKYRAIC